MFVGLLVYVNERSGARATGFASIAMLMPYVVAAPFAGQMAERYRPSRIRLAGLAAQAVGYGISAFGAYLGLPTWVVVFGTMIALGATTTLRPAGAVLLPATVRSSRELTVANLWVGYAESAAVLVGPIIATVLLTVDGARLVLAGCAALAMSATVLAAIGTATDPPPIRNTSNRGAIHTSLRAVAALRGRPGAIGVMIIAGGQFFLVGALDLVIVVSAEQVLDMGEAGAGVLSTMFGIGALLSVGVTTVLVRRRRLAPYLIGALLIVVAMSVALGTSMTIVMAVITLPVLGLSRSSLDLLARMMLQRSAPPNELSLVFGVLESTGGIAVLLGSLVAQILIAASGVQAAMLGVAGFFGLLLVVTAAALRSADDSADIPVVAMSLFRRDPVFSPLPADVLETVARMAEEIVVQPGEVLIRQGEIGDHYYVVADGTLEISRNGDLKHTAERGSAFGEVALLADVPRTATVTATRTSTLLAVGRVPFLRAVTGHDSSRQAAWGVVHGMDLGDQINP